MSEGILRHLVKARGLQDKVSTTIQGHIVIYCIYTKYSIYIYTITCFSLCLWLTLGVHLGIALCEQSD